MDTSYLSEKLIVKPRPEKGEFGVFAQVSIPAGDLLALWSGYVTNYEQLMALPATARAHSVQIEEGFYLVPSIPGEPGDYINHSCSPNAGMNGQIGVVAMRDITPGEEICIDYAMCDPSPYDEFTCSCGAAECRKHITGNDWKLPELWVRYDGFFSPYIQRKINLLKSSQPMPVKAKRKVRSSFSG